MGIVSSLLACFGAKLFGDLFIVLAGTRVNHQKK
jgi:hypothetical protein